MVSNGLLWSLYCLLCSLISHMVSYGLLCSLIVSYGILWSLMVSYGPFIVSYGLVCSLIVSYGILWALMHFFQSKNIIPSSVYYITVYVNYYIFKTTIMIANTVHSTHIIMAIARSIH